MAVPAHPESASSLGPLLRLGAHPVTGWPATLLSLLAGATLVLAFAPFDLYLLAPLALALWFALLRGAGPRQALRHGYAFGLGLFGAGASWIFNSLLIFGEAPLLVATLITAGFVLFLAVYPALLAWAAARWFGAVQLLPWLLALAGGFVLLEALRGWLLSGFPWLLVGHTLLDTAARGWLPVAGEFGAGLVVVLSAVALVLLSARRFVAGLVLLALLLLASVGAAHWNAVQPTPSALRVAIVQGNIEQSRKWADDGVEYALSLYSGLSREASGTDLLVWPETAIPAFYFEVYEPLEALSLELEAQGTELVTGIFDYDPARRAMYNSIRHLPSGATYDKRQLVPFGEFLPFRDRIAWLDRLLDIPMSDLTPGTGSGRVAMAGQVAGLSVCYEAAYARRIRTALPDAGFLLNVSNDAWFGDTLAPYQHLQIARVRALEMGRPMIRATNTGVSALIDADGRVTARAGLFTREVLTGEIQPRQGHTPAARFGAWPALLAALLLVLPAGWARRRSGR
ncbi:apolipoprotein N-acyltransferase [Thioalkalivibrio paradoxus]|uniref:apolipoprotein N-acyltransferase n=1 Tax=Thioalkalivibrio paradoxus TaxID=108010 RepID=UPI0002FA3F03|nr:apolipoprotein N-acyltransferase [Thioalkalivibrio paradoxus]